MVVELEGVGKIPQGSLGIKEKKSLKISNGVNI